MVCTLNLRVKSANMDDSIYIYIYIYIYIKENVLAKRKESQNNNDIKDLEKGCSNSPRP